MPGNWTYPQLASAVAAISPAPSGPAAAAAAINAQTVTIAVDVPIQSVAAYLALNGKLAAFIAWAASPPTGASAESVMAAKELAFMMQTPATLPPFNMTNSTVASVMESWLGAMASPGTNITGPITSTDQTAILALASPTVPDWQPAVTAGDVQTATGVI